jgi:hypothetical protein
MVSPQQQLIDFPIYQNSSGENFHHLLLMEADLFNSSVIEWILRNSHDHVNTTHNNDSIVMLVMITICYLIICLAGIVGNLITCIVIYKNKSKWFFSFGLLLAKKGHTTKLLNCLWPTFAVLIIVIFWLKNFSSTDMHTATNFYLFNLAVSDFLLLVFGELKIQFIVNS